MISRQTGHFRTQLHVTADMMVATRDIVVFSGGSAANNLVDLFKKITEDLQCHLSYVIPISDNGGSTSELIRVFGGPGIGDLRSRLVRLIPSDKSSKGREGLRVFFNYRLPDDSVAARHEWLDIVEARHVLWKDIDSAKKELIRSYLNLLNLELVKRARPTSVFNFSRASIGNMFLTGARLFTGSLESSIEMLNLVCGVPEDTSVLPCVNTNFTYHISVGLQDGTTIVGQNAISHPSVPTAVPDLSTRPSSSSSSEKALSAEDNDSSRGILDHDDIEDANIRGTLPSLRGPNISFNKTEETDLPSRIQRLWYISPYGHEIRLAANPKVLEALKNAQAVVYSIGSLYTSLIPNLILKGVGEAIMNAPYAKNKILILNGTLDRETGPSTNPFTATDFVSAIAHACWQSLGMKEQIARTDYRKFVTHVLYLEGPYTPVVDRAELSALGIESSKIGGRNAPDGNRYYDQVALREALASHIGRAKTHSRRNTLTEKKVVLTSTQSSM